MLQDAKARRFSIFPTSVPMSRVTAALLARLWRRRYWQRRRCALAEEPIVFEVVS